MTMEKDLLLTLDAGTTGCKCSVFNARGESVSAVRRNYDTLYPQPNWAEQHPDIIWESMLDGIKELLQQVSPQRIAAVGLCGSMNGCIPVDETGMPLHPNIIHSDIRSEPQIATILRHISQEDFILLTGNRADPHNSLSKYLWIKENQPDIYRRTRWFLNIKDYLYGKLTGRFGYTDYSDASLTTALDINKRIWADDLLKDVGLNPAHMPNLLKGHDVRGKITREIYHLTGLIPGTPVTIGGGDAVCTARGAGVANAGNAYTYIGSSAWVSEILDKPGYDPKGRILNFLDLNGEQCHVCGTVQCGAAAFDWCMKNILGSNGKSADISLVENMARQIPAGAEGVLFLPTLMGWRTPYWDPNTRGCLMGFSLYHDQRHIARAVYEGISFALKCCADVLEECGTPIDTMMLTGGGARSGLWPDILASAYGLTATVHQTPGETTSMGAAMCAGVGIGMFKDYADAAGVVKTRSTHKPNPQWQEAYAKSYPIYADIYDHIRPLNNRIAEM